MNKKRDGFGVLLIIAIMAVLMALFIVPLGFAQSGHDQGEPIGDGNGGTGGTVGSVATTDSLDGLKIPYPDTVIGLESPACDQSIIGGAAARIDQERTAGCEGSPGDTYFGKSGRLSGGASGPLAFHPSTPEQAKWYMNEPWPRGNYGHKKVVITAKDSNRSVVASIEESGPGGSCQSKGRCAGGAPDVMIALGWSDGTNDSRNKVTIAFAADQSVALGPITAAEASSLTASGTVPDFKQTDPKWSNIIIKGFGDTMNNIGCAITSLADVLAANGIQIDPGQLVRTANQLGIANKIKGSGGLDAYMAKKYGLTWVELNPSTQWDQTMTYLKQGGLVIANGKGSAPFTSHGHYVVFTSYNSDGTITVNDPYRSKPPTKYSEALLRENSTKDNGYISIFYKK